jgi:hypothetical protein
MRHPEWPAARDRTAVLLRELRAIHQRGELGPAAWVKYAPEDWARQEGIIEELLAIGARMHELEGPR